MTLSWREVAVIVAFIAGAIISTKLQNKDLSMVLAGAAAGFATNTGRSRDERQLRLAAKKEH
jgi:hypothetical protein